MSESAFRDWLDWLLRSHDVGAASTALHLFDSYYLYGHPELPLPEDLTLSLLRHPGHFATSAGDDAHHRQSDAYSWARIAERFLQEHGEHELTLAFDLIDHFGEREGIMGGWAPPPVQVAENAMRAHPRGMWAHIIEHLGPPVDQRAYAIGAWLRGDDGLRPKEGMIGVVPVDALWAWADADVERRAWYLATLVPPDLFHRDDEVCMAREVLKRYGYREDVRRNTGAGHIQTWRGDDSAHWDAARRALLEFRATESDANVLRYVDDRLAVLDRWIEDAKVREERGLD